VSRRPPASISLGAGGFSNLEDEMKQPENDLVFSDYRTLTNLSGSALCCGVLLREHDDCSSVWIASGATPLSACKAGVRRLRKLLAQAEKEHARLSSLSRKFRKK
jgi:hypothetical protein